LDEKGALVKIEGALPAVQELLNDIPARLGADGRPHGMGDEDVEGERSVQPEGVVNYHLRLTRDGCQQKFDLPLNEDAKVADLHSALVTIVGGPVTVRTATKPLLSNDTTPLADLRLEQCVIEISVA
jgi:hypothetical protein